MFEKIHKVTHGLSKARPFSVQCRSLDKTPPDLYGADMHLGLQIGIVLSGQMECEYSGLKTVLSRGQVWWARSWEPHAARAVRDNTTHLVLSFLLDELGNIDHLGQFHWAAPFSAEPQDRPQASDEDTRSKILSMGRRIQETNAERPLAWETLLWLRIHELILVICQDWVPPSPPSGTRAGSPNLPRIRPAIRRVQAGSGRPISLNEAADACHMSVSHFCDVFRHTIGVSFGKYERRARLFGAACELRSTRMPIKAIAATWGFTDVSHFYHAFGQHFESTPAAYRQMASSTGDESVADSVRGRGGTERT